MLTDKRYIALRAGLPLDTISSAICATCMVFRSSPSSIRAASRLALRNIFHQSTFYD